MRTRALLVSLLLTGALSLASASARAAIIVVDPDDFSDGTDISTAVTGVTLSVVGGGGGPVFSRTDSGAATGSRSFGNSAASGQIANLVWFEGDGFTPDPPGAGPVLRIDFAALTDFVAIDMVNQDSFDGGILRAFDAGGIEIDLASGPVTGPAGIAPGPQTLSVTRAVADIAYVTVAGESAQNPVHLDHLRFNQLVAVSAPASLTLLLAGLAGAVGARRQAGSR